jgi:opacity protein-like surface antigen
MNKLITGVLLASLAMPLAIEAQGIERGQKTLGLTAGYVTVNRSASAGLQFSYAFSRHFVLAPSIDYVFRNEDLDGLLINIDYHGPWQLDASGRWTVYHILGFNYASWSRHTKQLVGEEGENYDDVTKRSNHVGLDFGAGVAWNVTPSLRLSVQGKFNWIAHNNTGLFNAGISYIF